MTDEELMLRLAAGDSAALGELYDRYAKELYAFVLGLSGDPEAARDAVQEAFLKVLLARKAYRRGGNFKAWLFAIARNGAVDARRRRVRERLPRGEEDEAQMAAVPHPGPDPAGEAAARELAEALGRAVERLPEPYRESVLLAKYAGLAYEEIAVRQGVSVGTVKARVFRAISRLRKSLASEVEL